MGPHRDLMSPWGWEIHVGAGTLAPDAGGPAYY